MATFLNDLAVRLEASTLSIGYATTTAGYARSIFLQNLPSTAGSWIVLYPYGGMPPEWTHSTAATRAAMPRCNVLVVSTAADGGHQKSLDIVTALDNTINARLSPTSYFYRSIRVEQEPTWLGKDAGGRGQFSINFQVVYGG
jgi:hypothetical protein